MATRNDWIPIGEAAKRIGKSRSTVQNWLGSIPKDELRRDGYRWYLHRDLIDRLKKDEDARGRVATAAFKTRHRELARLVLEVDRLHRAVLWLAERIGVEMPADIGTATATPAPGGGTGLRGGRPRRARV